MMMSWDQKFVGCESGWVAAEIAEATISYIFLENQMYIVIWEGNPA